MTPNFFDFVSPQTIWRLAGGETMGIYQLKNRVSGKIYVGSASIFRNRWMLHLTELHKGKHANKHLQRAWTKHGPSAWEFSIIESVGSKELLVRREQYWMDELSPAYNICRIAGSHLGVKRDPSVGAKISAALKGRVMSPETIAKMSATKRSQNRKCITSEETRKKISESMKGNTNGRGLRGRIFSEETKAKMSASAKARWALTKD